MIDLTTKFGRQVKRRLLKESIIWFTTVGSDLTPHPRPVWFLWDGNSILIFSQPNAHKVRHIKAHPRVSVHFNRDEDGSNTPVITGNAVVDSSVPSPDRVPAYLKKYRKRITEIGMSPADMGRDYSVAIRVVPSSLRGD